MSTLTLPETAARSEQLIVHAERKKLDPYTEIDWDTPFDDSQLCLPESCLPLSGTRAWLRMTNRERNEYSRHELVAFAAQVIRFETVLMQLVMRFLLDVAVDDPSHRFLLLEVADECRHANMFGEIMRRGGTPLYPAARRTSWFGRAAGRTLGKVTSFIAILSAEQVIDVVNRRTMRDPAVHPIARQAARVHVIEETRHLAWARSYLGEVWGDVGRIRRMAVRLFAPLVATIVVDAWVNPKVFRTLRIRRGYAQSWRQIRRTGRFSKDLIPLTDALEEVGVITPRWRWLWRLLGLLPKRTREVDEERASKPSWTPAGLYRRFVRRVGAQRWFAWLVGDVMAPLDPWLYRLTRGHLVASGPRVMPLARVTSVGRKSGRPRSVVVLYLRDGDSCVVVGTNFGRRAAPCWVDNLRAHPSASVQIGKHRHRVLAEEVDDVDERNSLWARVEQLWPAAAAYEARTSRHIAVVRLRPDLDGVDPGW